MYTAAAEFTAAERAQIGAESLADRAAQLDGKPRPGVYCPRSRAQMRYQHRTGTLPTGGVGITGVEVSCECGQCRGGADISF